MYYEQFLSFNPFFEIETEECQVLNKAVCDSHSPLRQQSCAREDKKTKEVVKIIPSVHKQPPNNKNTGETSLQLSNSEIFIITRESVSVSLSLLASVNLIG